MKNLLGLFVAAFSVMGISPASAATCTTETVTTNYYGGQASCRAYDRRYGEWFFLTEYVETSTQSTVQLTEYGVSCTAQVPFLYSEVEEVTTCEEPTISHIQYEFGNCRYYTRQGFLDWSADNAFNYTVQEKSGSNWNTIYDGPSMGMNYSKNPGMTNQSYNLRIRAKTSDGLTAWRSYTAQVPSCWNGNGELPH